MNALLAMSAHIRAQRERGKEEALAGFTSRFATFSTAHGKAVQAAQGASPTNTQQDNGSAAQSAPAGTGAGTDGNGGDGKKKKRRRGR